MLGNFTGIAFQVFFVSPTIVWILQSKWYSRKVQMLLASAFLLFVAAAVIVRDSRNAPSNLYAFMGVSRDASLNDIKKAFRTRSVELHPDKNPSADAETVFNRLREAFDVLSDRTKRETYDFLGESAIGKDATQAVLGVSVQAVTFYLIWAVVAYLQTLGETTREARSWIYCGMLLLFIFEMNMLLSRNTLELPTWVFPYMTLHEMTVALHGVFPFFVNGCRLFSIFLYRNLKQENLLLGYDLLKSNKEISLELAELKKELASLEHGSGKSVGETLTPAIEDENRNKTTLKRGKLNKAGKPRSLPGADAFEEEKEIAKPVPRVPPPKKVQIPLWALIIFLTLFAKFLILG